MQIDPAALSPPEIYRLMISVVVPRPIAWVSTRSPQGALNAAPFSYFQALSSRPPMVMISVGKKRGGEWKDTRRNIEATGEFVIGIVSEESAERMVRTAGDFDYEVSEFEEAGLSALPSTRVRPPRIGECAVSMECRLDRILEYGASAICIGEVLLFHVRDDLLLPDRTVDPWGLRPLARLGGNGYAPLREVIEIPRDHPAVASRLAAEDEELLRFWSDLRGRTAAIARSLSPAHLSRTLGPGGDTVGRLLRHLSGTTAWLRLHLEGREREDAIRLWDPSFTPERLAGELLEDRGDFLGAMRRHLPAAREKLRRMIRHEAWHQGQIAACLRDAFEADAVWRIE